MTEGRFDQHFLEIFAKGATAPSHRQERAALALAALLLLMTAVGLLLH